MARELRRGTSDESQAATYKETIAAKRRLHFPLDNEAGAIYIGAVQIGERMRRLPAQEVRGRQEGEECRDEPGASALCDD